MCELVICSHTRRAPCASLHTRTTKLSCGKTRKNNSVFWRVVNNMAVCQLSTTRRTTVLHCPSPANIAKFFFQEVIVIHVEDGLHE